MGTASPWMAAGRRTGAGNRCGEVIARRIYAIRTNRADRTKLGTDPADRGCCSKSLSAGESNLLVRPNHPMLDSPTKARNCVRYPVSTGRARSAETCGNIQPPEEPSQAMMERMMLVFRITHGRDMAQEDRDYLGIPPCKGECCP